MRALPWLMLFSVSLSSGVAFAQREAYFGSGKPVVFKEEEPDRRFLRSRIYRALNEGTENPNCQQLLSGLLTVLGEVAPVLHKRDENFSLDPHLLEALNTQLTNSRFPGNAYLAAMVRRVLIDRRMPPAWLETAARLNAQAQIIDLTKLRLLSDGLKPIDSAYFTLAAFKQRYEVEVKGATSAAIGDVEVEFKDAYLDRDVAWGGLTLIDAGLKKVGGARSKPRATDEGAEAVVAQLVWQPPSPHQHQLMIFAVKPPPPVRVTARLAPQQYVDLTRLSKGKRMLVRGRLWSTNKSITEVEIREAQLFEDRDWSQGVVLADPQAVWSCPFAQNELTGLAPRQPGGFGQR